MAGRPAIRCPCRKLSGCGRVAWICRRLPGSSVIMRATSFERAGGNDHVKRLLDVAGNVGRANGQAKAIGSRHGDAIAPSKVVSTPVREGRESSVAAAKATWLITCLRTSGSMRIRFSWSGSGITGNSSELIPFTLAWVRPHVTCNVSVVFVRGHLHRLLRKCVDQLAERARGNSGCSRLCHRGPDPAGDDDFQIRGRQRGGRYLRPAARSPVRES